MARPRMMLAGSNGLSGVCMGARPPITPVVAPRNWRTGRRPGTPSLYLVGGPLGGRNAEHAAEVAWLDRCARLTWTQLKGEILAADTADYARGYAEACLTIAAARSR